MRLLRSVVPSIVGLFLIAATASVTAQPATALFHSPIPDISLAVALPPLQRALVPLKNLRYHGMAQLAGYGCGPRSEYHVELRETPTLDASYQFSASNGSYGAHLWATAKPVLAIDCSAVLFNNVRADIEAEFDTTVGAVPATGFSIPYKSRFTSAGVFNGLLTNKLLHPGELHIALPFEHPGTIPLCFSQPTNVTLKPEGPDVFADADKRLCRPLPYVAHIGGVDSAAGKTLVVDLFVEAERYADVASQADAERLFATNMPLTNAKSTIGVSVATSMFGRYAENGRTASGLLKYLLPLRVKTTVNGRFLFWKYSKNIEAVLDEGLAEVGGDGTVTLSLSSHWLSIDEAKPLVSSGSPVKSVTGRVVIDRLRVESGSLAFRVSDFRVALRTAPFVIPIKLSSGGLEKTLNNGRIDVSKLAAVGGDAPNCIKMDDETFLLWDNTGCPSVWRYMVWERNNRHVDLDLDPASFAFRIQKVEAGGRTFSFLQGTLDSR